MTTTIEPVRAETGAKTRFLALDLTRKCQAACDHCYNNSGPRGTAGDMTCEDWMRVLEQAAHMGVARIQFIGGEATLHPDLPELVNRALDLGMAVEVFSNLIHVRTEMWRVLRQRGVTLATSYYSDQADEHESITNQRGSYTRTKANIIKAISFRIPIRAALVHLREGQRVDEAIAELRSLGVKHIRTDQLRGIGRGAGDGGAQDVAELCGHCTRGRAAVMPNGDVAGCVMSGAMMTAGNIHTTPLASIIDSQAWRDIAARIPKPRRSACVPDSCTPREDSCQPSPGTDSEFESRETDPWVEFRATGCNPDSDGEDCAPAESDACNPKY